MKLDDYLHLNGLTGAKFAEQIGVDPATVYRIRSGKVLPHRKTLQAIWDATKGLVSPNDFLIAPEVKLNEETNADEAQSD